MKKRTEKKRSRAEWVTSWKCKESNPRTCSRYLLLLIPMLLLASCATGPAFIKADVTPDQGVIYIYRESHILGAAVTYNVRDLSQAVKQGKVKLEPDEGNTERVADWDAALQWGTIAGVMKNGAYSVVKAAPGLHVFMAEYWGGAGSWGPTPNIVKVNVEPGKAYYIHTSLSGGGRLHMVVKPAEQAEAEISSCHLSE